MDRKLELIIIEIIIIFLIIGIVLVLEAIFVWVLWSYYFQSAKRQLMSKADILGHLYNKYLINERIHKKARYILENSSGDPVFYMQVFDTGRKMVIDSDELKSDEPLNTKDIIEALNGEEKIIITRDKETNERIMAVSILLYHLEDISGILRYVVSVEDIEKMVLKISGAALITGASVIVIMFF